MNVDARYFDVNAKILSERYDSLTFNQAHHSWFSFINFKGKYILDVGCGSGRDAVFMEKQGGRVTAIDFSKELLNIARTKGKNINWIEDSLPELSKVASGEYFDFILASAVLMFQNEKNQIHSISKLTSLLKPGGTFVFSIKEDKNDKNIFTLNKSVPEKLEELNCSYQIISGGKDALSRGGINWSVFLVNKNG